MNAQNVVKVLNIVKSTTCEMIKYLSSTQLTNEHNL